MKRQKALLRVHIQSPSPAPFLIYRFLCRARANPSAAVPIRANRGSPDDWPRGGPPILLRWRNSRRRNWDALTRFARLTLFSIMASSTAAASSSSTNPVAAAAAAAFVDARLAPSTAIAAPSGLTSVELGYEVQREMLTSAAASARLGGRVGWKAGATNAAAQSAMGFGPFLGPVFGNFVVKNGG